MLQNPTFRSTGVPLILAAVAMVVLNVGLYTRLGAQPTPEPLGFPYQENFDDDSPLGDYAVFGGSWDVRDATLVQISTTGFDLGLVIPLDIAADQTYRYQADIRFLGGNPGGGLMFNVQNDRTRQRSHMARFNLDGDQLWLMYGYYGDDSNFIGQGAVQVDVDPSSEDWQTVAVIVRSAIYDLEVNGTIVAADIALEYRGGNLGLITAESQIAFDNLNAQPIASEPTAVVDASPQNPVPPTEVPSSEVGGALAWRDTFDNTTDGSSNWLPISGVWDFRSGAVVQTVAEGFDLLMIRQDAVSESYQLTVQLRHESGIGGGVFFNLPRADGLSGGHLVRYFADGPTLVWGYFEPETGFVGQSFTPVDDPAMELQMLSVVVDDGAYTIYLNEQLVGEPAPIVSVGDYVGLTSSQSVVAFELVEVVAIDTQPVASEPVVTQPAVTDSLELNTINGQWITENGVIQQLDQASTDFIAGTGVLAETFTISVDILLPTASDVPDSGAGVVLHMSGREDRAGGSMVRFANGGTEIFWGAYDDAGVFQGFGSAPLQLESGVAHNLRVTVRTGVYDIYVNGDLLAQDVPMTTTQGWVALLSFRGPTEFSNVQLSIGE